MCVWVYICRCSVTRLCLTFCGPMDYSPCSVHRIFQARTLEQVATFPYSRESSWPKDWTHISCVCCIGWNIFYYYSYLVSPTYYIYIDDCHKMTFFFENCHRIFNVNTVPSLYLGYRLGLTWASWMVSIYEARPSHPAVMAKQDEQEEQAVLQSTWAFCARAALLSTRRLLARSIPKHSVARL